VSPVIKLYTIQRSVLITKYVTEILMFVPCCGQIYTVQARNWQHYALCQASMNMVADTVISAKNILCFKLVSIHKQHDM